MTEPGHIPVLMRETLELLNPRRGETYVDMTAGLGGHAAACARSIGPDGLVVLNDADPENLEASRRAVEAVGVPVKAYRGNFAELPRRLEADGLSADCVLADLGFSSNQMDTPSRGFSFMRDGPLDMRLDPEGPTTAADLVNGLTESELARIISEYGEDRQAGRIARKLVEARGAGPIQTTGKLAEVVRRAVGPRKPGGIDPATRTFQALRIAVNDELGALDALLASIGRAAARLSKADAGGWLKSGARVGLISFHSLEDRQVKRAFAEWQERGWGKASGLVQAEESEVENNPRARSAKLRVFTCG